MKKLLFWSIMVVSLAACNDNNTITYTTTDGEIIDVNQTAFDAEIVSNTYKNGEGKIVFNQPLTSIGESAIQFCSSLTSVSIPNSVTNIGVRAFYDCYSLTSVEYNGTKEQWDKIEKSGWAVESCIQVIRCTDGEIRL